MTPSRTLPDYWRYIPRLSRNENLYYVTSNGAVRMFGKQARSVTVPGQAGTGQVPLSKIAVSAGGHYLAGIAGPGDHGLHRGSGRGRESALVGRRSGSAQQAHRTRDSPCLAGTVRATCGWRARVRGSPGVWVVPAAAEGSAVQVILPLGVGPVTGLRVAPDGVRVALIVGTGAAAHMVLGAITHSGASVSITHWRAARPRPRRGDPP